MAAFAALFDPLYCPEEHLDLYHEEPGDGADEQWPGQHGQQQQPAALDDELPALFEALRAKEGVVLAGEGEEDGYGGAAGREATIGWASRAAARLGFSALTAALAAAYLDRCFLPGGALWLGDQPWIAGLTAVSCVALAAKVEETHVPLLPDLQLCAAAISDADAAESSTADPYVFEAKTVRRMELLVLSALGWWMHPVTPFSYLQPVLADAAMRLRNCEGVLLAVMADWRWPRHQGLARPSAWAAAALQSTAGGDADVLALINAPEDETAECAKIISEVTGMSFLACDVGVSAGNKHKHAAARMYSSPLSPRGVIGALSCFSCESWTFT
ncbi:cyclin-D3-2-like [Miscanthus floridulus]|uniref:cyclin-D3-2-like n=1 Tax=Miscanthus floridulus TaxID=154761 RepID=UPI00345923BD